MLSMATARQTRSANNTSNLLDDLSKYLQSSSEFISLYNQCYEICTLHSSLIVHVCSIFSQSEHVDPKIVAFLLDDLTKNGEYFFHELSDLQFKQDVLPFIKQILSASKDIDPMLISIFRFLMVLIEH